MNLDSPHTWRWLWILVALLFVSGEILTPAVFFFLPFAVGALIASILCFAGVSVSLSLAVFLVASGVAFASLWKLGRRLEAADSEQESVGSTRFLGAEAIVETEIEANGFGTVRLEREQWRAQSLTNSRIPKGSTVLVTKLAGVALVVVPVEEPAEEQKFPEIVSTQVKSESGDSDDPAVGSR